MLVFLKMPFAAGGPAQGQLHRLAHPLWFCGILGALVEGHDDVGAEPNLRFRGVFRAEEV